MDLRNLNSLIGIKEFLSENFKAYEYFINEYK
jgi:hypothetical protein